MTFPIEAVFAILAIEVFRSLAQPEHLTPPAVGVVAFATAGWVVWSYIAAAALARRTRRRLRRAQGSTVEILEDFRFRVMIHKVILVILCIAYIAFTQWPAFVEDVLRLPAWSVVDDLAAIAPFVAAMVAGWAATFHIDKALSRRSWGLGEYIWFQARYSLLLVLGPWIILKGIDDSRELWPQRVQEFADNAMVSAIFFALLVGAAAALLPVFLKWLFRAISMPPSPMRERLEAICRKARMRFRDILVWRMERARVLNAGVMGVVPRYRYVMFSDALLESLQPEECEAVLAHEIAHSRFLHPVVYLLFTLGFVALAYDFMALLPPALRSDYLVGMPVLAILVVVYFRFLFGYLSRAFERQADVYAAGLVGTPVPLILALEKIALMSGDIRELRSWRHHSVNERVRYLGKIGYSTEDQTRYHRRMGGLSVLVALSVVLFVGGAAYIWFQEPEGVPAKIEAFEDLVRRRPTHDHAWMRLGELETERGDAPKALRNFCQAIRNNPNSRRALRGIESLELPEAERRRALSAAYIDAGFADRAVAQAKAAREAEPFNAASHEALARALLAAGDLPPAEAAASEALRLDPQSSSARELLKRIREQGMKP